MSWPAPPILESLKVASIECEQSPNYLLTFKGAHTSELRTQLKGLHNPNKGIKIIVTESSPDVSTRSRLNDALVKEYADLIGNTKFGLVPRGEHHFSYRLMETLAAGAIPVILSDDWILPFSELVEYDRFAVVLAEQEWPTLVDQLRSISDEQQCLMREEGFRVFHEYFNGPSEHISTLLAIHAQRRKNNLVE